MINTELKRKSLRKSLSLLGVCTTLIYSLAWIPPLPLTKYMPVIVKETSEEKNLFSDYILYF